MRADHQLAIARVHDQVVDGNGGQPRVLVPCFAAVDGHEQPEFGAEVKQFPVPRIFANHVDRAARGQIVGQRFPGLTMVGGLENIRRPVIVAMAIDRQISRRLDKA